MGKINEIKITDKMWNNIVKEHLGYEAFYLSEYVKGFMNEKPSNGEPILLHYQNGKDSAINVVFKRDISACRYFTKELGEGSFFDLISPYGYGGFVGEISDYKELNKTYVEYCQKEKYICEFVRFNLFSDYYKYYSGNIEKKTHNVIVSLEVSLDRIWSDFKSKVRRNIRRANKNNLEVIVDKKGMYLDDFLRIYYLTMNINDATQDFYFSKEFFETISSMEENSIYFHALYQEKIVSTELVLYGKENCYFYLGGTDRNYSEVRPNEFLKYEIIKWAKENGFKNYVLGGGYGSDDGIFRYKEAFAPNGIVDFYIGKNIFDMDRYKMLCDIREVNYKQDGFFPAYRS